LADIPQQAKLLETPTNSVAVRILTYKECAVVREMRDEATRIVEGRLAPLVGGAACECTTMPERLWGGIASCCQSVPSGEQECDHEGNEEPHDGVG
jgi:hypothetical protein